MASSSQPLALCPCSRKKGMEFVHEFHGVLPTAFKQLLRNSDEKMKKAVTRLVDIWEERKVTGRGVWAGPDQVVCSKAA